MGDRDLNLNYGKLFLGVVCVLFDIMFVYQHYYMYYEMSEENDEKSEKKEKKTTENKSELKVDLMNDTLDYEKESIRIDKTKTAAKEASLDLTETDKGL